MAVGGASAATAMVKTGVAFETVFNACTVTL